MANDDIFPPEDAIETTHAVNTETGEIVPQSTELVAVETKPALALMEPNTVPDLDAMEPGMNIAPTYWEVEDKGAKLRAVLIGWSQMNSQQGGTIPLAVLQNKAGIWTNAGSNLVQQLRNISVGTPLEIIYEGKEKTNGGNQVKKFTVRLLNPPAPKPTPTAHNLGKGVRVASREAQPA